MAKNLRIQNTNVLGNAGPNILQEYKHSSVGTSLQIIIVLLKQGEIGESYNTWLNF